MGVSTTVATGIILLVLAMTAEAATVVTSDGRELTGTIVAEKPDGAITIEVLRGTMSARLEIQQGDIEHLDRDADPTDQAVRAILDRRAAMGATVDADALWGLVQELRELDRDLDARAMAREVVALDPEHHGARSLLRDAASFDAIEGELYAERGFVRYRGAWVTPRERELLVRAEEATDEHRERMHEIRSEERRERLRNGRVFIGTMLQTPDYESDVIGWRREGVPSTWWWYRSPRRVLVRSP